MPMPHPMHFMANLGRDRTVCLQESHQCTLWMASVGTIHDSRSAWPGLRCLFSLGDPGIRQCCFHVAPPAAAARLHCSCGNGRQGMRAIRQAAATERPTRPRRPPRAPLAAPDIPTRALLPVSGRLTRARDHSFQALCHCSRWAAAQGSELRAVRQAAQLRTRSIASECHGA